MNDKDKLYLCFKFAQIIKDHSEIYNRFDSIGLAFDFGNGFPRSPDIAWSTILELCCLPKDGEQGDYSVEHEFNMHEDIWCDLLDEAVTDEKITEILLLMIEAGKRWVPKETR